MDGQGRHAAWRRRVIVLSSLAVVALLALAAYFTISEQPQKASLTTVRRDPLIDTQARDIAVRLGVPFPKGGLYIVDLDGCWGAYIVRTDTILLSSAIVGDAPSFIATVGQSQTPFYQAVIAHELGHAASPSVVWAVSDLTDPMLVVLFAIQVAVVAWLVWKYDRRREWFLFPAITAIVFLLFFSLCSYGVADFIPEGVANYYEAQVTGDYSMSVIYPVAYALVLLCFVMGVALPAKTLLEYRKDSINNRVYKLYC